MNPRRFPEADHSYECVTDGLITVPDDHQLNGEVEILIFVTTNTTIDTQKESTPPPEEVSPFCEQLILARYGIDSNVRRRLTPSAMLQRPSMWDHDMLRTKENLFQSWELLFMRKIATLLSLSILRILLLNPVTREAEDLQGQIDHAGSRVVISDNISQRKRRISKKYSTTSTKEGDSE
ncbi:hypothetical protein Tco_1292355 [Tanacetum coccineum]